MKPMWKGLALYFLLIIGWLVIMLPQALVVLGAGAIWGLKVGTAVGLIGKTVGSMVAFFISRRYGASIISSRLKDPKSAALLRAIDILIVDRPHFFTFLVCASLIPAFIKYYGLGSLAGVPWQVYLLYNFLWGIPFCIIFAYVGASAKNLDEALSSEGDSSPAVRWATLVGLIFTVLLFVVFGFYARRTLFKHVAEVQKRENAENGDETKNENATKQNVEEGGK